MRALHIHAKAVGNIWAPAKEPDSSPVVGGMSAYLMAVLPALERRGCDVGMAQFSDRTTMPGSDGGRYFEIAHPTHRRRGAVLKALARILERTRPQVLHLHSLHYDMHPGLIGRIACQLPTVFTLHDVAPFCFWGTKLQPDGELCRRAVGLSCLTSGCYRLGGKTRPSRDLARLALWARHLQGYRRLPMILVPSGYLKEELLRNGFDERRIRVIPNFSRYAVEEIPPPPSGAEPRILFVGRLTEEKGVLHFLRALTLLEDRPWRADVAGEGPLEATARSLVDAEGMSDRIRFLGALAPDQLAEAYRSCSMVVMPSLVPESFGLVGVEAMTFARPVVAFPSGGIGQWLDHGVTGLAAARGSVDSLAGNIRTLLENPSLRQDMGLNAAQAVKRQFNLDKHVDCLLDAYDIANANPPANGG